MIEFKLNGAPFRSEADPDTPLLWVIREEAGLTGTKFGCGIAQCGACTVHVDGFATRSCVLPVEAAAGAGVTTIEGIAGAEADAVKAAWIAGQVPQCGYCQSGQVMTAVALLAEMPAPTDDDISNAMTGNICRCATYMRIRAAIHAAARTLEG
jgi:isoquinoline 1-oxidoreductase alpha subunit